MLMSIVWIKMYEATNPNVSFQKKHSKALKSIFSEIKNNFMLYKE